MKTTFSIQLELPEGDWEGAEIRRAVKGDVYWLDDHWDIWVLTQASSYKFLVLIPAASYRTPSLPEDAGKTCRFSNDGINWVKSALVSYSHGRAEHWESQGYGNFKYCEIREDL